MSIVPETPVAVVAVGALENNIASFANRLRARGVGVRPHTKTSKCIEIISRQVDAGTVGLTVATLGEAESLVAHGFDSIFQAFPVWAGTPQRARRIRDLHEECEYLAGVESAEAAEALAAAVRGTRRALSVLIEVDCGMRRSGVAVHDLAPLAERCSDLGLHVRGAFTFGGHAYASCDAPPEAADDEVRTLAEARDALRSVGIEPEVLSAGSTPTALHSARPPVTDERPGTYVFLDRQQVALGAGPMESVSLFVLTTVVASHADGRFVLDAGSKVLSTDRPSWLDGYGFLPAYPDATVARLSEHHAVCTTSGTRPRVGDVVALVPNHCCVVVNLTDTLHSVDYLDPTADLTGQATWAGLQTWSVVSRGANT